MTDVPFFADDAADTVRVVYGYTVTRAGIAYGDNTAVITTVGEVQTCMNLFSDFLATLRTLVPPAATVSGVLTVEMGSAIGTAAAPDVALSAADDPQEGVNLRYRLASAADGETLFLPNVLSRLNGLVLRTEPQTTAGANAAGGDTTFVPDLQPAQYVALLGDLRAMKNPGGTAPQFAEPVTFSYGRRRSKSR